MNPIDFITQHCGLKCPVVVRWCTTPQEIGAATRLIQEKERRARIFEVIMKWMTIIELAFRLILIISVFSALTLFKVGDLFLVPVVLCSVAIIAIFGIFCFGLIATPLAGFVLLPYFFKRENRKVFGEMHAEHSERSVEILDEFKRRLAPLIAVAEFLPGHTFSSKDEAISFLGTNWRILRMNGFISRVDKGLPADSGALACMDTIDAATTFLRSKAWRN